MTTYSSYILEPIVIFQESLEESQFFHWQDEVRHREGLIGTYGIERNVMGNQ